MRRIAKAHRSLFRAVFTITAVLLSFVPVYGQNNGQNSNSQNNNAQSNNGQNNNAQFNNDKKNSVIVRVHDVSHVAELSRKYGLQSLQTVNRGTGATFLVKGLSEGQLKQLLRDEPGFAWAESNKLLPLDGGETVLPLDGGETVLPLDGGETVLPLGGSTDQMISQLLDGGETVLPLEELNAIRNAYKFLAVAVTPSSHLLLQPAFRKIGLYPSIPGATGRGVIIADLDTGADTCHEALSGVVTYTFVSGPDANAPENCPTNSTTAVPGYGHGTRVASLLRLVAPEATVWAMRVFDNTGSAQIADIYSAVIFAADHGVSVINMSFGTVTCSHALQDAMDYARSRGVILVAAGGNSNVEPLMYPAQIWGVAGVVAVTTGDIRTSFSNYGTAAAESAPGYGLWVAHPNHKIAYVAGTSYASPLVAGAAALVIDTYQRIYRGPASWYFVRWSLYNGVQPIDSLNPQYSGKLGHGRLYIPSALGSTQSSNTAPAPAPAS